jgi:YfiH family protein
MIQPRDLPGIAFGQASDGDLRGDAEARRLTSVDLGIPDAWAVVDQVHGSDIVHATSPGNLGSADGIITSTPMLPIAVATADCVPVVIVGMRSRAIVHAGWRGVAAGIVRRAIRVLEAGGDHPRRAVIGPHIGGCCYEVGPDVIDAIGGYGVTTRDGSLGADLGAAIQVQLEGIEVEHEEMCTMHDTRFHSHRRNTTKQRQMAVAWIPRG